jgi:hypothetical protein
MFRLQGLVTLVAVFSRRARVGFVSRRRRSWDSPFGAFSSRKAARRFRHGPTHLPFFHPVYQPRSGGPARAAAAPGFTFRESLAVRRASNTPRAGCSLGFTLLGYASEGLGRGCPRSPLTRLRARLPKQGAELRPRVSIGSRLAIAGRADKPWPATATLIGFLRLKAP